VVDAEYLRFKIDKYEKIRLSTHAKHRAELRGIKPEKISSALKNGDILSGRTKNNPNTGIDYSETYLVLISSRGSELYYLHIYFTGDTVLVTSVLKLSESNFDLLEW
jgi:hypothetical protein